MTKKNSKIDIGLSWAKAVNVWGQIGLFAGVANTVMLIGVLYTTTVAPKFSIPFWLYILIIMIAAIVCIIFVMKIGISGYYRFFSQQSELSQVNKKVSKIMKRLNIEEDE